MQVLRVVAVVGWTVLPPEVRLPEVGRPARTVVVQSLMPGGGMASVMVDSAEHPSNHASRCRIFFRGVANK